MEHEAMTTSTQSATTAQTPQVLLVPGLGDSGPNHWQSLWNRDDENCHKVELGLWDRPHRNTWVNQLNLAIHRADGPVILVAHSLGCLVVAWWAKFEQPAFGDPVVGALLVAPPEVDFLPRDERLTTFAPTPSEVLPFPSLLVASRDDEWMSYLGAQSLARRWGSELVDAGALGHFNEDSDLGHWPDGRRLLARLMQRAPEPTIAQTAVAASSHGLVQGGAPQV